MLIAQLHDTAAASPLLSPKWLQCVGTHHIPVECTETVGGTLCRFANGTTKHVPREVLPPAAIPILRLEVVQEWGPCLSLFWTPEEGLPAEQTAEVWEADGSHVEPWAWTLQGPGRILYTGGVRVMLPQVRPHQTAKPGLTLPVRLTVPYCTMVLWSTPKEETPGKGVHRPLWVPPEYNALPYNLRRACGAMIDGDIPARRAGEGRAAAVCDVLAILCAALNGGAVSLSRVLHFAGGVQERLVLECDPKRVDHQFVQAPEGSDGTEVGTFNTVVSDLHSREGWDNGIALPGGLGYFTPGETPLDAKALSVGDSGLPFASPLGVIEHAWTPAECKAWYIMQRADPGADNAAASALAREQARLRGGA